MAEIQFQKAKLAGVATSLAAATIGGDKIRPNEQGALLVKNADASAKTVTIAVPGKTRAGADEPDVAVVVAAGATEVIGPLPQYLADPTDGLIHISYSAVTSVTVGAIEI